VEQNGSVSCIVSLFGFHLSVGIVHLLEDARFELFGRCGLDELDVHVGVEGGGQFLESGGRRSDEADVLGDFVGVVAPLNLLGLVVARRDELAGATAADLFDLLHGLDRLLPEIAVVLDGNIAALLELERRIDGQVLAGRLAERLSPFGLARVLLLFEGVAALGPAESEYLAVIADENNSVARINI